MLPKLGTYELPEGRCEITRRDTPEFTENRQVLSNTIRLDCSSALYAEDVEEMDGLVEELLQAFADFQGSGEDFVVYLPGGRKKSQLSLYNAGSIGGVRIVSTTPAESLKNAGYVTWLPFSFSLEAEYPAENAGQLIREWTETITPVSPNRDAWLLALHGDHQLQQVREKPFYEATQAGTAIGYLGYPTPPSPIWPNAWMNYDEPPGRGTPKPRGNGYIDYPISWNYRFQSNRPLIGTPTRQPQ